ncbi:MAG: hypothetical protein VX291_06090, partial [Gemmatimonadota bacterium]|nr:hypothetical protein [Gemmatimonadota bacterium]
NTAVVGLGTTGSDEASDALKSVRGQFKFQLTHLIATEAETSFRIELHEEIKCWTSECFGQASERADWRRQIRQLESWPFQKPGERGRGSYETPLLLVQISSVLSGLVRISGSWDIPRDSALLELSKIISSQSEHYGILTVPAIGT